MRCSPLWTSDTTTYSTLPYLVCYLLCQCSSVFRIVVPLCRCWWGVLVPMDTVFTVSAICFSYTWHSWCLSTGTMAISFCSWWGVSYTSPVLPICPIFCILFMPTLCMLIVCRYCTYSTSDSHIVLSSIPWSECWVLPLSGMLMNFVSVSISTRLTTINDVVLCLLHICSYGLTHMHWWVRSTPPQVIMTRDCWGIWLSSILACLD